jgi:hypothetical protein
MSGFEFIFSVAGLLFGLAVANLATGYADVWRDRARRPIGVLTVLLGLVLILSICHQWLSWWGAREVLTPNPFMIFMTILVGAPFVFLSQAMFPRPSDDWGSHDQYFLEHRHVMLGILAVSPVVSMAFNLIAGNIPDWLRALYYLLTIAIPILLIFFRSRWLQIAGLAALAIFLLIYIVVRFR